MQAIINPGKIAGVVTPPPSKSMMQRACAAAILFNGITEIHNAGNSNDENATLEIIRTSTTIHQTDNAVIEIHNKGAGIQTDTIDCGESGLAARIFIPIAAMSKHQVTITGQGTLLHRPMQELINILPQLGVSVIATNNCLPLSVTGPMKIQDIILDGSVSSQFLTGVLIAFAFNATEPVTVTATNLVSRPYIDLTLQVLQHFGCRVVNNDYRDFMVLPNTRLHETVRIDIETDWSAAANYIVANAMNGEIEINNLNHQSLQADAVIEHVVKKGRQEFEFDAIHCPDLIPILAVYGAYCYGINKISGLHRLIHKESNRITSVTAMLQQLGVEFRIEEDSLLIKGGSVFHACTIDAHNDHRIVMAAAIAALHANGSIAIDGAEAVNKSYPSFFTDIQSMGIKCQLVP